MTFDYQNPISNPTGYFIDHLLVATPMVSAGCFHQSVIYTCAHNDLGAMGVMVNLPITSITLADLADELGIKHEGELPTMPIHFGGPVDRNRGFMLHTPDITFAQGDESLEHTRGIVLSSGIDVLTQMISGKLPKQVMFILGCAIWGPGQLEKELEDGLWVSVPATAELVFGTNNDDKWQRSTHTLGVDINRFSHPAGHA